MDHWVEVKIIIIVSLELNVCKEAKSKLIRNNF